MGDIDKLDRIQKNYTSKIKGMENLNYHERLIKLNLYSLERRRERFMIINAWEQLEASTVPCGTPDITFCSSDIAPLATTLYFLSWRKFLIHTPIFPFIRRLITFFSNMSEEQN